MATISPPTAFIPESGMTEDHFRHFQDSAREEQVIALVRNTNRQSTALIQQGCPGKPKGIDFHTSESTGVVTVQNDREKQVAQERGYLVVEPGNRVARGYTMQNGKRVDVEWKIQNAFWKVEVGQLIDPKLRKPLAGDYDLMSVIDPRSPGQNIALVANGGRTLDNVESPIVTRYKNRVNGKFDMPRVHHGAQDQYSGFRGGATIFFPDGRVAFLPDEVAVEVYFNEIGRQTRLGRYGTPPLRRNSIPTVSSPRPLPTASGGARRVVSNHGAMEWLGQGLSGAIQSLGDIGTRRQIQNKLTHEHASSISEALDRGQGVLVIIVMQEWIIPDFNGARARGLLEVYVEPGATQTAAIEAWRRPKILKGAPWGWRTYEEYVWIEPPM